MEAARVHVQWCPESKITRLYEKLKRKRGARNRPLGIMDKLRNLRISKQRAPVERHYAVLKRVFKAGHVLVTTVPRVNVKMIFTAVGFNLYPLCTLRKQGVV